MEQNWEKKLEELNDNLLIIKKKQRKIKEIQNNGVKHVTFNLPEKLKK
jgi:uncharacterized protein involved in tolerance to divalent cations